METRQIGKNVSIGHHCFIGRDVIIKDNVTIKNNVTIECPALIGEGSFISSGVVIGTDGFGYFKDQDGNYKNVPHLGGVKIGKKVVIGANACINRGTIEDTIIGDNVKIANLCNISHNVKIENNVIIITLSMIGGSAIVEKDSYIAPGSMIKNQAIIGKNAFVGMGAVVLNNVPNDKIVVGVPAEVLRERGNE